MNTPQQIILVEGHDGAGKTTLSRALSDVLHIPYFKNRREKSAVREDHTRLVTEYAGPFMVDFLAQTGTSAIFDRSYPSEFAYGGALGRKIDLSVVVDLDARYAELGTTILLCQKDPATTPDDDLMRREDLTSIQLWYRLFAKWTKCRVITIDTTSERTCDQLEMILPELVAGTKDS